MVFLPDESEASTLSAEALAALTAAANSEFIANATTLIINAIALGNYEVQALVIAYMDIPTVTTYFQGYGYAVLFPIIPPGPYNPAFVPGFPEVLPPGYHSWGANPPQPGPPRIQISWGP